MDRDSLISAYFHFGLMYKEIVAVLAARNGITLSIRQLKRILKRLSLKRREYDDLRPILFFIANLLNTSGKLHGYRMMYTRCLLNGFRVRMDDVQLILQALDPEGVELRKSRRLHRREYFSKGPNFIWHIDGYDKLKRFGLCISGCICGFSRYVIWLNVYRTNNNPKIIAGYFIEAIQREAGFPKTVRCDYGTENVVVREIQLFLSRAQDERRRHAAYIDGASTSNQRIEQWWGFLRKENTNYWLELFRGMEERGDFNGGFLDRNLIQFCFMSLIQDELDRVSEMWNHHTIRPSRNQRVPYGKPNAMYITPTLWGANEEICWAPQDDIQECLVKVEKRSTVPCDKEVYDLCLFIMRRDGLLPSSNTNTAIHLYNYLRGEMVRLLE